ncbi:MAG: serine acetyltransferase [Oscillospiraceae bacterium]|nr:serine acetyltransferase [Oscillospiraceae bacterium]
MNQNLSVDDIAARIISSHDEHLSKDVKHPDYLPSKDEVVEIITLLQKLLFPGYFDDGENSAKNSECATPNLVKKVEQMLSRQICRSLNLDTAANESCANMYGKARGLCTALLCRIPDLIEILLTDVRAAYDGDPAARSEHEIIYAYPGIFAISVYRLAHELHLLSVPLLPRMMTEYAHSLTGIDIHPGADISHHFFIDHGTGVVIGETTQIGAYVKLYQGVTLGGLSTRGGQSLRGKKRHPTLEDEVTVYSGASILGGDTIIGKGSVIGGNAFITKSVSANTRVYLKNYELEYSAVGTRNTE